MMAYEKLLFDTRPDMVVVVGDVNSTMACTLAAVKLSYPSPPSNLQPRTSKQSGARHFDDQQPTTKNSRGQRPLIAHLEAGLRSFDRTMPEEINRMVTDSLADLLWTPSVDGDENLMREGVAKEKIERVGNIMIDSLEMMRLRIEQQTAWTRYGLEKGSYGLVTLHRPANVDPPQILKALCDALIHIAAKVPQIFPIHPRTRKNLETNGLMNSLKSATGLYLDEPLSYVPFMNLVFNCRFALTDSGGIQEETTYLGKPCLTLRPNTERPITVSQGTNRLIKIDDIENEVDAILAGKDTQRQIPELWDGHTAERVVESIRRVLFCEKVMDSFCGWRS
jgi:UDP-N-acetylglucosamine 2-epimerase (non-hydrolysing)